MMPHQLNRLARWETIGIGRHSTPGGNNSGDIFLAFSTANAIPRGRLARSEHEYRFLADEEFDPFYMAAAEATEEAVVNAMAAAEDMTTLRPPGKQCRAIDIEALQRYSRMPDETRKYSYLQSDADQNAFRS